KHYRVPADQYFYPLLFEEAGYYRLNPGKTDYNTKRPEGLWDEGENYTGTDDPFLAVFNKENTHMSSVRKRTLPEYDLDISHLPHLPDLPKIRDNYGHHLFQVERADTWVGERLADLKKSGKEDDTIIFFYSDHGGCQPRGKAYPFESGLQVPLIIYVPPKWRHLAPDLKMGEKTDRMVEFTDFAPTILSLAGIEPPDYMQGKAFMGPHAQAPRQYQFGFRSNQDIHYDPIRTVSDGRFKYMRNYMPYRPLGLRQAYQWAMEANLEYDQAHRDGKLKPEHARHFEAKPTELLFDLQADPFELNNLAGDPAHQKTLETLRAQVSRHIRATKDLGFFPPSARMHEKTPLYDWVREQDYPLDELYALAEMASDGKAENAPALAKALESKHPAMRFWGASGLSTIASRGQQVAVPAALLPLTKDPNPDVAAAAAEALCFLGEEKQGVDALMAQIEADSLPACSALETFVKTKGAPPALQPHLPRLREIASENVEPVNGKRLFYVRSILVDAGINTPWDLFVHEPWALPTS
ncbi:MAG: sulfatase-like hydrolase/transferase, partial [Verrucomicrobiota bacterium]